MSSIFGNPLWGLSSQSQISPYQVTETYGQVRAQLTEEFPGTSLDLLDRYIVGRFRTIVQRLEWEDLRQSLMFQTIAPFNQGLVAVFPGSTVITLAEGYSWGPPQNALYIRLQGELDMYQLTVQGANNGQLDRPYAGRAANGIYGGYQILAPFYPVPALAREIQSIQMLDYDIWLDDVAYDDLNMLSPSREEVAYPRCWAPGPRTGVAEPYTRQIEIYPIPDKVYNMKMTFITDYLLFGPNDTELFFPEFLDTQCLKAGVRADLTSKDINSSLMHEKLFEKRLMDMMAADTRRRPPAKLTMAPWVTRHREIRHRRSNLRTFWWRHW